MKEFIDESEATLAGEAAGSCCMLEDVEGSLAI
jgi:hypothetical protein